MIRDSQAKPKRKRKAPPTVADDVPLVVITAVTAAAFSAEATATNAPPAGLC